jgi:hypothetical protein
MSPFILPDRDSLPTHSLPPQTTGETTMDDLPVLTEVVAKKDNHLPDVLSVEEIQLLLPQLEEHIQTLFTQKLALHLEQLQRQAIEQAISELKAELPELLKNMLNAYLHSR